MNNLPQRKPNRLKNFDYTSINYYYVTLCAKDKKHYFGKIENSQIILNKVGRIIDETWMSLPEIFGGIELDEAVIMPNHFHGILIFRRHPDYIRAGKPASLSQIIGAFKSKANVLCKKQIFPNSAKVELWQKTFYDRVIRNEHELLTIREYINNNPLQWELDEYNRV